MAPSQADFLLAGTKKRQWLLIARSVRRSLQYYVGAKLLGAEIKEGPSTIGEYGEEHEVQFLEVQTSKGVFTMSSHNEHNGYYGGFCIRASEEA